MPARQPAACPAFRHIRFVTGTGILLSQRTRRDWRASIVPTLAPWFSLVVAEFVPAGLRVAFIHPPGQARRQPQGESVSAVKFRSGAMPALAATH